MSKESRQKKKEIRTIEYHLRNYNAYKVGMINLQRKLDYMFLPNITSNWEVREGSVGVFTIHSTTEDVVLTRSESLEVFKTTETIKLYEMVVETIDRAMKELNEEDRKFVTMRYFRCMSMYDIGVKLHYSERHMHRIRYNVLNHFLISLSNIKDLKI